jgi:hypothetical protein
MGTVLLGSQTFGEPYVGYAVHGYYPGGPLSHEIRMAFAVDDGPFASCNRVHETPHLGGSSIDATVEKEVTFRPPAIRNP